MSDEAERLRKEAKKAKKAEKRKREEQEAAAAAPAEEEPSASPQASADGDEEERASKKAKKAEKKARKEAEAAAAAASAGASASAAAAAPVSSNGVYKPNTSPTEAASPMTKERKNFYQQHKEVAAMTPAAVAAVRAEHKMTLSGNTYGQEALYAPVTKFSQAGFSKQLLKCTEGFTAPTGIQAQCWPVLLMGRDAIAIAETGSGQQRESQQEL